MEVEEERLRRWLTSGVRWSRGGVVVLVVVDAHELQLGLEQVQRFCFWSWSVQTVSCSCGWCFGVEFSAQEEYWLPRLGFVMVLVSR